jgi:heme exporter protein D
MPFSISLSPLVWLGMVAAILAGLLWIVDEIGDRREAKVVARYEARDAEIAAKAKQEAEDAEAARLPAARPGSLARLQKSWCRDCGGMQ